MTPTLVPPFTQDLGILCQGENAKLSHSGKAGSHKKYCMRRGKGQGLGVHIPDHIGLPALNTGPRSKSSLCIKGNGEPRKVCEPRRARVRSVVGKTSLLCPRFPSTHTLRDYTEQSQCRLSVSSFCHLILSLAAPSHQAQSYSCQGAKGWSVSQAGSWKWNCWLIGLFLS